MNSVEPPLAPQKQRRTDIPDATNDNHQLAVFMKAALMYEQPLHKQRNSSTSGYNATCVLQGYSSRNRTHTVLPKLIAWP